MRLEIKREYVNLCKEWMGRGVGMEFEYEYDYQRAPMGLSQRGEALVHCAKIA